ncbi:MAG TPA: hypothetical protein VFB36_16315 [Nevskiaceae bacterium]|nr:hypothetical protein [Nevskiaceae bacterium]
MSPPQIPEGSAPRGRALEQSRRIRFTAIVLWSSFLGGVVLLIAWLAFVGAFWPTATDLAHLSRFFFIAWALSAVPALFAAALASPPRDEADLDGH